VGAPGLAAAAEVHGYTSVFYFATILFAVGLLIAALVLPRRARPEQQAVPETTPEMA
jgi:hypothetical protein